MPLISIIDEIRPFLRVIHTIVIQRRIYTHHSAAGSIRAAADNILLFQQNYLRAALLRRDRRALSRDARSNHDNVRAQFNRLFRLRFFGHSAVHVDIRTGLIQRIPNRRFDAPRR